MQDNAFYFDEYTVPQTLDRIKGRGTTAQAQAVLIGALQRGFLYAHCRSVEEFIYPVDNADHPLTGWRDRDGGSIPHDFWQVGHREPFARPSYALPHRSWLDPHDGRARHFSSYKGFELPHRWRQRISLEIGEGREWDDFIWIRDVQGITIDQGDVERLAASRSKASLARNDRSDGERGRPRKWHYEDAYAALVVEAASGGIPGEGLSEGEMARAIFDFLMNDLSNKTEAEFGGSDMVRIFAADVARKWTLNRKPVDEAPID